MLTKPKVVIVEDNRDLKFIYTFKLESEGFVVEGADNGQEGLEVIERVKPDVILLDLMMPVMGGAEMLTRLRAEDWASGIRVIVLTNLNKHEAPPSLRFLDVDRYVIKAHHTPAQIVEIIEEVVKENKPSNQEK